MNFFTKLLIVIGAILVLIFVKDTFFEGKNNDIITKVRKIERFEINKKTQTVSNKSVRKTSVQEKKIVPKNDRVVGIYYTNLSDGELRCLYKEVPQGEAKFNYAIKSLLAGPTIKEINQGYSSEIPKGTKLLGMKDTDKAYIINISDEFQYGGGTESQYLRLNQLIKTVVSLKLDKPVYLYLNGRKAEVIGGEGIQITQPLSEKSLNE